MITRRALVSAAMITGALASNAAGALDRYRWVRRLVLVFAADESAPIVNAQRKIARENARAFEARDLTVIEIIGSRALAADGAALNAEALHRRFGVRARAEVALLIGKDGGEKLRSVGEPLTAARLFAVIDVMPMRRREMRERGE